MIPCMGMYALLRIVVFFVFMLQLKYSLRIKNVNHESPTLKKQFGIEREFNSSMLLRIRGVVILNKTAKMDYPPLIYLKISKV